MTETEHHHSWTAMHLNGRRLACWGVPCLLLCVSVVAGINFLRTAAAPAQTDDAEPVSAQVVLRVYCQGCHQNGRARLEIAYEPAIEQVQRDPLIWKRAVRAIKNQSMPPEGYPHPTAAERDRLVSWIEQGIEDAAQSRFVARRLTAAQYRNAVRDLLGVDAGDLSLPADQTAWSFHRETPVVPSELAEHYAVVARQVVQRAQLVQQPSGRESARGSALEVARRALRRPLLSSELAEYTRAIESAEPETLPAALAAALEQVLTAPSFLYRIERRLPGDADERAAQFDLAARLAFFFWDSVPDESLLAAADSEVLVASLDDQALRMLADARATTFARRFAASWLELDKLDQLSRLSETLRRSMREETDRFIEHIVAADRPPIELVAADYSFVDAALAHHYGLDEVPGDGFRQIHWSAGQRGGLLAQASLLTMNAELHHTSPTRRGVWVLDRLLGQPAPTPPPDVLDAFRNPARNLERGTTKQVLLQHRTESGCAYCHAPIDSLGLALEHFDDAGAWRTHEHGQLIDATGALPDGTVIQGVRGLKDYLLEREDMLLRNLAGRLLKLALERPLRDNDELTLERITSAGGHRDRFSALVLAVVRSESFQRGWLDAHSNVPAGPSSAGPSRQLQ